MLTLIKREIQDAMVYFLLAVIFISCLLGMLIYQVSIKPHSNMVGIPPIMYGIFGFFVFVPLVAAAFGASQMKLDKDKKISSFLNTLATTRRQILSAKIITGFLWILLLFLPVAAAYIILLKVFPPAFVPIGGFGVRVFVTFFVCTLACYSFGLLVGWQSNKLIPALGVIHITMILVSLIVIKGFGFQIILLLVLFSAAALVRMWQKFMTTAL